MENIFEVVNEQGFSEFWDLYKKNKEFAIKYFRVSGKRPYRLCTSTNRTKDGVFYTRWRETLGISKTDKLYKYKKTISKISMVKKNRSIYVKEGEKGTLYRISTSNLKEKEGMISELGMSLKELFMFFHPNLEYLSTFRHSLKLSITAIKKHKLYSLEKAVKYKWPFIHSKFAMASLLENHYYCNTFDALNFFLSNCKNPDHFFNIVTLEGITSGSIYSSRATFACFEKATNHNSRILQDTVSMAHKLREKVDLKWSAKRMRQEHDRMANEINHILMTANNKALKVHQAYKKIPLADGVELIDSTGRLTAEGMNQGHCVASYTNRIERGKCAIFSISKEEGMFTAEVSFNQKGKPRIVQLKGKRNSTPPNSVLSFANDWIESANKIDYSGPLTDLRKTVLPVVQPNNVEWEAMPF